ncbi:DUF4177 domain-containing protein [Xanthomonadaceae bacterium XH05]|nr:DUF4177 domain-containing protein [Xanthomonadaceae bacterium XH05]
MSNERWEYKVIQAPTSTWGTSTPELMTDALNKEGQQGWELVSTVYYGVKVHLFLKRPR